MSKNSRKRRRKGAARPSQRSAAAPERDERPAAHGPTAFRARPEDAPQPAWAPFPLTELVILLGIVLLALGWLIASGDRRMVMVGGGIVLVSLASGELALREHLAGYRSHSTLLAALAAFLVAAPLWLIQRRWDPYPEQVVPVAWVLVFAISAWQLRELFKRRSGGVGFRV